VVWAGNGDHREVLDSGEVFGIAGVKGETRDPRHASPTDLYDLLPQTREDMP
jgi:hypothetical protein